MHGHSEAAGPGREEGSQGGVFRPGPGLEATRSPVPVPRPRDHPVLFEARRAQYAPISKPYGGMLSLYEAKRPLNARVLQITRVDGHRAATEIGSVRRD